MYEKITLENGLRIVFEKIPYVRSVSLGIWVGTGARFEPPAAAGASHFIEHMVFKGTHSRTAAQLAAAMDEIGGQVNAFTTKECTCFYGRVLDTHLGKLTDILCDMLTNSRFDDGDVTSERGVIFEEIDMYEDAPEDLVTERLFSGVFKSSPLGKPILGSKAALEKMDSAFLRGYMATHYNPKDMVVALSGNFSDGDIQLLKNRFSGFAGGGENRFKPAAYTPAFLTKKKPIEQNHLCFGFPGMARGDDRRFALQLMSGILGGGMSSRLFQSVREKRGLCYSVYSFTSLYQDVGLFGVCTALSRETEQAAISVILDELRRLVDKGVTLEELSRAREQMKANILMSLESTSARMNMLGKGELSLGKILSAEETAAAYDAVTAEDILSLAREMFTQENLSFSAVGRVSTTQQYKETLRL